MAALPTSQTHSKISCHETRTYPQTPSSKVTQHINTHADDVNINTTDKMNSTQQNMPRKQERTDTQMCVQQTHSDTQRHTDVYSQSQADTHMHTDSDTQTQETCRHTHTPRYTHTNARLDTKHPDRETHADTQRSPKPIPLSVDRLSLRATQCHYSVLPPLC